MKKSKVENVSDIKLDFFLKQNKADVRIVLSPGESSWCDNGTTTKSMILYERKNLIRVSNELDTIEGIEYVQKNLINALQNTIEEAKGSAEVLPSKTEEVAEEVKLTPLEIAKREVEEYKQAPDKKYTGKKRGRKKKRGPKPGAKKAAAKKVDLSENTESDKTEE